MYQIALGRSAALGGFALEGSPAPGGNIDMLGTNASNIEHSRRLRGTGLRPEDSPGGHFVSYVLGTVRRKLSASVPNVVECQVSGTGKCPNFIPIFGSGAPKSWE